MIELLMNSWYIYCWIWQARVSRGALARTLQHSTRSSELEILWNSFRTKGLGVARNGCAQSARPDRGADQLVNNRCADVFVYNRCADKFIIADMCAVTKRDRTNESWHTIEEVLQWQSLKLSNLPGGNAQRHITSSTHRLFSGHQGLCVRMCACSLSEPRQRQGVWVTLAASPMHATRLPSSDKIGLPMKCGIFRFSIQVNMTVSMNDTISNADLSFFKRSEILRAPCREGGCDIASRSHTPNVQCAASTGNALHLMCYIQCVTFNGLYLMYCIQCAASNF